MSEQQPSQAQLNAQRALELATTALTAIQRHESDCRQRQEDILDKLTEQKKDRTAQNQELKDDIKSLRGIIVKTMLSTVGALFVMLLGVIGWLLSNYVLLQHQVQ